MDKARRATLRFDLTRAQLRVNLANQTALYNCLFTFSGTHYVTPRALTAELGFHF